MSDSVIGTQYRELKISSVDRLAVVIIDKYIGLLQVLPAACQAQMVVYGNGHRPYSTDILGLVQRSISLGIFNLP